jgi:predicted DNA binding CopG/RHH family protein
MENKIDNIEAAMDRVADAIEPTRSHNTNTAEGETTQRQVLIRSTERDHDRWKAAAAAQGISTSEFIRNSCNAAASVLLDCQHPLEFRKIYPWSDVCLKCGTRFR